MTERLLPHLVSQFSSHRREDLATEALAHVLNQSEVARTALQGFLAPICRVPSLARMATQQVDERSASRPDLVAYDHSGDTPLLLEAKFDAGLTENQPHEYLRQTDGVVLIVAPQRRTATLWPELLRRSEDLGSSSAVQRTTQATWAHFDGHATLALTTWRALLDPIVAAVTAHEPQKGSDVEQLAALCEVFASEAFKPFTSEELTSEQGRRFTELADLIDEVTARLLRLGDVNKEGLRAAAGRGWYGHYLNFASYFACLLLDTDRWARSGSPLWITIRTDWGREHVPQRVERALRPLWGTANEPVLSDGVWGVPLKIPVGKDRDEVLAMVEQQLVELVTLLRAVPNDGGSGFVSSG